MEKNKIRMIVFFVLVLIGTFVWFYPYSKRKGLISESVTKEYGIIDVNEPSYAEDFFEAQKNLEEKRLRPGWVRNPFILPQKESQRTESAVSELALSGISVDEIGRIAIINDEIVREGDNIFGIKVIEIKEDSVTVEKEGKNYTLKIY